jgi:hypothetical protein
MMLDDDDDLVQHQEYPAADSTSTRYVERIRAYKTTMSDRLRFMYHINDLFTRWECKFFSLVPLYSWEAKYITIDTIFLYYLLGGRTVFVVNLHTCYELTNALAKSFPTARCPLYTRERKWPKDIQVYDNDRWCWCLGVFLTRWKWMLTYDEAPEERETRR